MIIDNITENAKEVSFEEYPELEEIKTHWGENFDCAMVGTYTNPGSIVFPSTDDTVLSEISIGIESVENLKEIGRLTYGTVTNHFYEKIDKNKEAYAYINEAHDAIIKVIIP